MVMLARFFRSDAMAEKLGEIDDHFVESPEFFQLTYDALRDMEGATIAVYDAKSDSWVAGGERFSDCVIYNADPHAAAN
jgi:hypothetical protein